MRVPRGIAVLLVVLGFLSSLVGCNAAPTPPAIQVRIDYLNNQNPKTRRRAVRGLWKISHPKAIQAVVRALKDRDADVRREAAWVLGQDGKEAASAVPDLLRTLATDSVPDVQKQAALAIGWIGRASAPAVPELMRMLNDSRESVRGGAATALGWIGAYGISVPTIVPGLKSLLHDPSEDVVFHACDALGDMGSHAKPAVPALLALLAESRSGVKWGASRALESIQPSESVKETLRGRYLGMAPGDIIHESTFTVLGTTGTYRLVCRFWKHEGEEIEEEGSEKPAFYKIELHSPSGEVRLPCNIYGGSANGPQVVGRKLILFCAGEAGDLKQVLEFDLQTHTSNTIHLPSDIDYFFGSPSFSPNYTMLAYAARDPTAHGWRVRILSWPGGKVIHETPAVEGPGTDASFDAPRWIADGLLDISGTVYGAGVKEMGGAHPSVIDLRKLTTH